jgi:hypothetical protein
MVMFGFLAPLEKILNRYLTNRYAQRYLKVSEIKTAPATVKIVEKLVAGKS